MIKKLSPLIGTLALSTMLLVPLNPAQAQEAEGLTDEDVENVVEAVALGQVEEVIEATLVDIGLDFIRDLLAFIGLDGLLGEFDVGLIQEQQETVETITETVVPDLANIREQIRENELTPVNLQAIQELGDPTSLSIVESQVDAAARRQIEDAIAQATTTEEARIQLKELVARTVEVVEQNSELAAESSETDVSQQLLQNISQQLDFIGQLTATSAIQTVQAQKDRANLQTLQLQIAQALTAQESRTRATRAYQHATESIAWSIVTSPLDLYPEDEVAPFVEGGIVSISPATVLPNQGE